MLIQSDSEESTFTITSNNTSRPQTREGQTSDLSDHAEEAYEEEVKTPPVVRGRPKLRRDGSVLPMASVMDAHEDEGPIDDDEGTPRPDFQVCFHPFLHHCFMRGTLAA